jgi:PAS domain S-box-containing protein
VAIVLGLGLLLFDIITGTQPAFVVFYALAVAIYARPGRRSDPLAAGIVCSGLLVVGWLSHNPGAAQTADLVNRGIALAAIWLTVALLASRTRVVQLGDVLDSTADAIAVADRRNIISLVNSNMGPVLNYGPGELIGKPVSDIIPEIMDKRGDEMRHGVFSYTRQRPAGSISEMRARRSDGVEFPAEVKLSPMQFEGETHTVVVIRDVTDRKRAERELALRTTELERSNAELEQFAYVASHDLQEPLRMVSSYVQLLARRYKERLDADADEFIDFAVDGAERMRVLINDLLEFSRVGTDSKELESIDCDVVLDRAIANLRAATEESRVTITHDRLPTVMADDTLFVRLFQNLIGNAIKFRRDVDPAVHVSASPEEKEWVFSFKDNGIGIAPEHYERIFQVFQRLHSRTEYPGTGIGLAVCKKVVERQNGRMWVESDLGKGATFFFSVPRSQEVGGDPL